MKDREINKKGQVWIETVLYTLIGIALIGMVLAFALPKINESKDRVLVEQTINTINDFDLKINEVLASKGSVRHLEFLMRRGELFINGEEDKIVFVLGELGKPYSEPGATIQEGRIEIVSTEGQKTSSVELTLDYSGRLNLVNEEQETEVKFNPASIPYRFRITNKGGEGLETINIEEVSGG